MISWDTFCRMIIFKKKKSLFICINLDSYCIGIEQNCNFLSYLFLILFRLSWAMFYIHITLNKKCSYKSRNSVRVGIRSIMNKNKINDQNLNFDTKRTQDNVCLRIEKIARLYPNTMKLI
ncbi:hypothetical protein BpHYR1_037239 [Brachionus plicatilis]|uniref:Uncharacterized protein n=1 Tax=Brachionus plicatilis TaxID=10195 RepID=A0A3M7T5N6_BRAPC|nr:hypothetical protein BpHYR1_037239 [Brachionus plicatilis]